MAAERDAAPYAAIGRARTDRPTSVKEAGKRWRRGGGFWLVYLLTALGGAWTHHRLAASIAGTVLLVAFGAGYLFLVPLTWWGRRHAKYSYGVVGILFVLMVGCVVVIGPNGWTPLIFVAAASIMLLPTRVAVPEVATLAVIATVLPRFIKPWHVHGLQWQTGAAVTLASLAVYGFTRLIRSNHELAAAREQVATMAAERERLRIARDLHDLLGHSLTTVTVKAALATRLFEIDPVRAKSEIAEVEQLARESLADVRAAVAGYREVRLVTELATAREVLAAAGIEVDLPGAIDCISPEIAALYGWVVREGVTNIVRHSRATSVRITLDATNIEIVDDGPGLDDVAAAQLANTAGNGLAGLAERAAALGGRLVAGPIAVADTVIGFRLRVDLLSVDAA
jgi:two-component system, NarL family, sensor histidine kinase DesK